MSRPAPAISYADALNCYKRAFLRAVLAAHGGNQCAAARELQIHRNTLSRTLAALGIDWREFAPQGSAGAAWQGCPTPDKAASQAPGSPRRATFAPRKSGEVRRTA